MDRSAPLFLSNDTRGISREKKPARVARLAVSAGTLAHPRMPSTHELLILLIAVFALWFLLKMVKLAIRVILFVITVAVLAGVVWFLFVR